MVELMGVEPTAYTMRTCRSSQLSYSPLDLYLNIAWILDNFKSHDWRILSFFVFYQCRPLTNSRSQYETFSMELISRYSSVV